MRKEKPVCIEWDDASYNSGYYEKTEPERFEPVHTKTVGFVVKSDRKKVILCMDRFYLSDGSIDERHTSTIPKKMIKRIIPLGESNASKD